MAFLYINKLKAKTLIGCLAWEQETPQEILVDVRLEFDEHPAAVSDNLDDTINYATLAWDITRHLEQSRYRLIEKLAHSIMTLIFKAPQIQSARVKIFKPGAIPNADSAAIEITQQRTS